MVIYITQLPWRLGNTTYDNRLPSKATFANAANTTSIDGRTFSCPTNFPKYKIVVLTSNGVHELICTSTTAFSPMQVRDQNSANIELIPIYLKLDQNPNPSIPYCATANTSPSLLAFVDNIMATCTYLWNGQNLNCLTIADLLHLDISPDALTDLNTNYPIGTGEVIFPEILHKFFELCGVMKQWRVSPISDLAKDLSSAICSFTDKDLALDYIWGCIDEGVVDTVHNNINWVGANTTTQKITEEITMQEFFDVVADTLGNIPNDALIQFIIRSGSIMLGKLRPFLDPEIDSNNQLFNNHMHESELTIHQFCSDPKQQICPQNVLQQIPYIEDLIHHLMIASWNFIDVSFTVDELHIARVSCETSYNPSNVWGFAYNNMVDLSQNTAFENDQKYTRQRIIITLQHIVSAWITITNRNVFKVRIIKTYSEELLLMLYHTDNPEQPQVMYFDLVLEVMGSPAIPNTPVFWGNQPSKAGILQ